MPAVLGPKAPSSTGQSARESSGDSPRSRGLAQVVFFPVGSGFRIWVLDFGFRVPGMGLRDEDSSSRVEGLGIYGLFGFRCVLGFMGSVWDSGIVRFRGPHHPEGKVSAP